MTGPGLDLARGRDPDGIGTDPRSAGDRDPDSHDNMGLGSVGRLLRAVASSRRPRDRSAQIPTANN